MHAVAASTVGMLAVSALLMFMGGTAVCEAFIMQRSWQRKQLVFESATLAIIGGILVTLGCMIAGQALRTADDLRPNIASALVP